MSRGDASQRRPLTPRQAEVLAVITGHIRAHGCAPTVREIAEATGLSSINGVVQHLDLIARKGYLRRDKATHRGLTVINAAMPTSSEGGST